MTRYLDIEDRDTRVEARIRDDLIRGQLYEADRIDNGNRLSSWTASQEWDSMARPKGSSNKKKTTDMQAALDFVSCAITENTEHWKGSLQFREGFMLAFDGVISAGVKVSEEFAACPHFGHMKRVVERAALEGANFTQLDVSKLAVTAGKFKAVIPCLDPAIMPPVVPDANIAPANDALRAGFEIIGPIVKENGLTVVEASLLLQGSSMVACDRILMAEYYHGNDLPPGLVLPKRFVNAIVATKKKIVGFGFTSGQTMTLHFEDGSWIKTQLFSEAWPSSWSNILNKGGSFTTADIPEGFFDAVAAVVPFSEDGAIHFDGNAIRSHETPGVGASYDFNCPPGFSYSGSKLLLMKGRATKLYFSAEEKCAYFFSDNPPIRSALAQRNRNQSQSTYSDSEVRVPPQFQPPVQQPPQEAPGEPLQGEMAITPGGWENPFSAAPEPEEVAGDGTGVTLPEYDPGNAWKQHQEQSQQQSNDGWGDTRSDVPIPE